MGGIDGTNDNFLKLGKTGNQVDLNAFNGTGIQKNETNKSIFEKFDFNKDGKLDKKEIDVLKAFLLNRAGDDGILSKKEILDVKQFGTKKSDVNNFYAALNDMYLQQVALNEQAAGQPAAPVEQKPADNPSSQPVIEETVEAPVQEETRPNEEELPQNTLKDTSHQYKVNYKDTWYGIVQAKYGITDHNQTMEIVHQLKAQNNVDPKAANMPEEITLPDNITLKDGTEIKLADIDAAVDQSHWGYKTTSKTGRYTITQNGKTKYYAADGTELKQSYFEAKEASPDKLKKSENGSGRYSYTAENGETWYFAADGTPIKEEYYNKRESEYTAVNAQKDTVKNARAAFEKQQDEDGWAGKTADAVSVLWNSDNRAVKVEADLKKYETQIKDLQKAQSQGSAQFNAKFKEIFGVDYNPENVAAYEANPTEENYKKAYGTKNDIHKRVMDYNASQQAGAAVVKTTAEIGGAVALTAATIATGGVAGVVAAGAVAAGSTVAADLIVETTDRMSSEQGLQEGEFTEILGNAATDGAIAGVTFGAGKALGAGYKVYKGAKAANAVNKGVNASVKAETGITKAQQAAQKTSAALSKTEEAVIDTISDVAVGAGAEYYQTGEVTVEGTLTNAAVGSVGIAGEKLGNKIKGSNLYNKVKDKFNGAGSSGEIQQISSANGRDVIADGETARNINQQHLNANQRKMVDEALEDVPTPEELDAYAKEIAYKAPTPEEQAAIDIHQAKVKQDYDDAHKIENNAVIKEQKTPSAVKTDIDKLNDEIKALDGSIRRIEQQIAGAKRFGKDTSKLESQLTNLQAQRKVKADKLSALETANANSDVGLNASDNLEDKANDLEPLQSSPLTSEDRMAMAQIGNNINRAKTLEDLEAAQDWLDKLPECGQKTRLQSQLVEKLGQLSDIPDNIGKNKADNFTSDIKSGKSGGKSNSAASSKRPQYRAGIDYNQAPSFTQYSKAELRNMFEAEPLSADRFRQLAENYYDDLRLSGKYTMEESITGNFDDFLDYNPSINGIDVYFDPASGWIWHEFNNGCKRIGKDRISLATKADPQMLAELDELLLKGSYTDAAGNVHQLKGKEFSRGFYKTDTNEESWCQRHDPLTFYFDETVSDEMIDALAIVTDKYKRIPQRELPGAVDGCPWIAHEAYTTGADIDALIKEAAKVDRNLADALKSEGRNISTGQYNSYKKLLADYKQYLSL